MVLPGGRIETTEAFLYPYPGEQKVREPSMDNIHLIEVERHKLENMAHQAFGIELRQTFIAMVHNPTPISCWEWRAIL